MNNIDKSTQLLKAGKNMPEMSVSDTNKNIHKAMSALFMLLML
jgi:hypothetical protein